MSEHKREDPLREFPLEEKIAERAAASGIDLSAQAVAQLAAHAREVLRANQELHLTAIDEPALIVERHLGEAFEGAAMLKPEVEGLLLDLGSGNGYPGIPLAVSRPGLELLMAEASARKAAFLRACAKTARLDRAGVLEAQVQRTADLGAHLPIRLLACRAMGKWPKVIPRLASGLAADGELLLWAGADAEAVSRRAAWARLRLEERKALPGRDRSWIWRFVLS